MNKCLICELSADDDIFCVFCKKYIDFLINESFVKSVILRIEPVGEIKISITGNSQKCKCGKSLLYILSNKYYCTDCQLTLKSRFVYFTLEKTNEFVKIQYNLKEQ